LLFPSDYISARMLYLKRRWLHHHQDPSDYTHLFESQLEPKWFSYLSLNKKDEEKRVSDILAGKLGQYLLMNWVGPIPPEGASGYESALDTAWNAFLQLRKLQPAQGLFLDSLAALAHQKKLWDLESAYLDTLSGFNPFGDQDIQYRRANSLFLGGHYAEAKKSLKRCESFQHEARWLLIKAAALCSEGNIHKGRKILEQSLKLDKTNHEAFLWWKKCSSESEQSTDSLWVKRWEIRTQ